jgi:spore maturation protein CgeB
MRLQPFDIRVFGDQGWQQILNSGVKILPPVNYHRELPLVFSGTDVNVNATSFQMVSAVNQRVFDTAACGAFLVTDRQPDMDELFDRTRETACYDDAAQAKDHVAYYLKHPRARHEITQRARRRVLGEHTYVHRLTRMITVMKHEFGSF